MINQNRFKKRGTKELLTLLPECHGYRTVESINGIFESLEEKVSMMTRVMMSLVCKVEGNAQQKLFTEVDIINKMGIDCVRIRSLIGLQKEKLTNLKNGVEDPLMTVDPGQEQDILRQLFPGKRRLPDIKESVPEKKRKTESPESLTKALHHAVLLHPTPIFKVSKFQDMNPGRFSPEKLAEIINQLKQWKLIRSFPIREKRGDYWIVKELRQSNNESAMRMFGITREMYLEASILDRLAHFKMIMESVEKSVAETLESQEALRVIVAELLVSTVVTDSTRFIQLSDFPVNVPLAVGKAIELLYTARIITVKELLPGEMYRKRMVDASSSSSRNFP